MMVALTLRGNRSRSCLATISFQKTISPDDGGLDPGREHVEVEFAAHEKSDRGRESRILLQDLWWLLLHYEGAAVVVNK